MQILSDKINGNKDSKFKVLNYKQKKIKKITS
jgi:hypothetical protein